MFLFGLFFVSFILHVMSDDILAPRISGGNYYTDMKKRPYLVHIIQKVDVRISEDTVNRYFYLCSGTILNPRYILTAAHNIRTCPASCNETDDGLCTGCYDAGAHQYTVYYGSPVVNLDSPNKSEILRWHIHPQFKYNDHTNQCYSNRDIAIGELPYPLEFSDTVNRVRLPFAISPDLVNNTSTKTTRLAAKKQMCKVFGWGKESNDDDDLTKDMNGKQLKVANVQLIETHTCLVYADVFYRQNKMTPPRYDHIGLCLNTHICTIDPEFKSDTCKGDSGGPLMCNGIQVGITSHTLTDKCALENQPAILTRVDINVQWIGSIIGTS